MVDRSLPFRLLLITVVVALLPWSRPSLAADSLEQLRQRFQQALSARRAGQDAQYLALKESLQNYPLYAYLDYEDLSGQLDRLDLNTLTQFRERNADSPLPTLLQRHWLARLAKRQRWQQLIDAYDPELGNTALECHYRYALLQTGQVRQAYAELAQLWVVGHSQHDACDPLFQRWLTSAYFSPNYAWQRFWLALANNNRSLARYAQRLVTDPTQQRTMQQGLDYQRSPEQLRRLSRAKFEALPKTVKEVTLARLNRTDPAAYLEQRQRLGLGNPVDEPLVMRAVMYLLRSYAPHASQWAARIDPEFSSLELLEWRIREALYRDDWAEVGRLLEALPPSARFNDRWRYWQGVQLDRGEGEQRRRAEQIFTELSRSRSFYGFLAADRIGGPYHLNNDSEPAPTVELTALSQLPGLQRARELFYHGQLIEARREWFYATADASTEEQYRLAQLARSWGWYSQAIRATIAAERWNDLILRFPLAFNRDAAHAAERYAIDTQWVLAVIRQESAFMADARSPAGAMGLMQLMPATARQTARQQRLRYRDSSQLHDPEFNITLGSAYLSQLYRRFDGRRALASAAYNAGPHRVTRWLEQRGHLPMDAWIETIPFDETRHYVQNVLSYALIYSDLLGLPKRFMREEERTLPRL